MARVTFWQKPGCRTNGRQRAMLLAAGHEVDARDLLTEPWTAGRLAAFFKDLAVPDWFNRAAPQVKSGTVDPAALDAQTAMPLLLAEPLLIRRPLMEAGDWRCVGFDMAAVDRAIGLALDQESPDGLEGCAHAGDAAATCPPPTR